MIGGTMVALLVIAGGWVMAASFAIQQGTTENGGGAYHATSALTFWTEASVGVATQPGTLPTTLSTTAGAPTVLSGSAANYAANTPTANDVAHFWKYTEAAGAPVNTEVELQLTVSTGGVPVIAAVTVFIETQAAAPGSAITFTIYSDLGSPSSGTITLNSVTQVSQECSAVGTCP